MCFDFSSWYFATRWIGWAFTAMRCESAHRFRRAVERRIRSMPWLYLILPHHGTTSRIRLRRSVSGCLPHLNASQTRPIFMARVDIGTGSMLSGDLNAA